MAGTARGRRRGRGRGRRGTFSIKPLAFTQDVGKTSSAIPPTNAGSSFAIPVVDAAYASPSSLSSSVASTSAQQIGKVSRTLGSRDPIDQRIWLAPKAKLDFDPPKDPVEEISKIIKAKYDGPWLCWMQVPSGVRDTWYQEFQKAYKWLPEHEKAIRASFEHRGSRIMKSVMNKVRNGKDKGSWILPEVKEVLKAHWARKDFKRMCGIVKENDADDGGASLCHSGSIPAADHKRRQDDYIQHQEDVCAHADSKYASLSNREYSLASENSVGDKCIKECVLVKTAE